MSLSNTNVEYSSVLVAIISLLSAVLAVVISEASKAHFNSIERNDSNKQVVIQKCIEILNDFKLTKYAEFDLSFYLKALSVANEMKIYLPSHLVNSYRRFCNEIKDVQSEYETESAKIHDIYWQPYCEKDEDTGYEFESESPTSPSAIDEEDEERKKLKNHLSLDGSKKSALIQPILDHIRIEVCYTNKSPKRAIMYIYLALIRIMSRYCKN